MKGEVGCGWRDGDVERIWRLDLIWNESWRVEGDLIFCVFLFFSEEIGLVIGLRLFRELVVFLSLVFFL